MALVYKLSSAHPKFVTLKASIEFHWSCAPQEAWAAGPWFSNPKVPPPSPAVTVHASVRLRSTMHHKKQNSVVPLMDNFAPSELPQGGPGRESSEAEATAAVSSSKPSPGKVIVRRGSKNSSSSQRLYSECSSPSPPPVMRRSSSGASVGISSSLAAGTGLTPALPGALPDSTTQAPTQLVYNGSSPSSSLELGPSMEVAMAVDGHRALASLGPSGLRWSYDITRCCVPGVRSESVPFEEILAAEVLLPRRGMVWVQRPTKMFRLAVYTFRRAPDNPSSWHPRQIVLETTSEELVLQWSQTINAAVAQQPRRPRHLLVIVNPYGGAKQARALYQSVVQPVFGKAGIKMTVMETQRQGHARVIITDLPLSQLEGLDGVVAIGGDGLFHEIINGMLELRSHDGDERGRATQALRVGHIPAGSTDAVAYSLNGTRSAFTAACHIALGDGMPLDVLRIDTADGHHEFATCMASYGFMGDLMEESERYRWLGPKRYDLIGAKMLAHNRAYRVRVSYLPPPTAQQRGHSMVCHSHCQLCTMEKRPDDLDVAFREASHHSLARRGQEWQVVEGDFAGIMLVIMPCRSDKSAAGVAKYGHLCDGVVHLVLVRRCSRWQYLRFLLTMSNKGLEAGKMGGYIEVMPAVAVKVEPLGKESRWNVDGELLPSNHITSEVHRGLVEVFARGVER